MKSLVNQIKAVTTIMLITGILQVKAQTGISQAIQPVNSIINTSSIQEPAPDTTKGPVGIIKGIQGDNNSLRVYPNPATDKINIDLGTGNKGLLNYEIYNLAGGRVASENSHANSSHATISVNDLAGGTYILSVISDKQIINRKIVIYN